MDNSYTKGHDRWLLQFNTNNNCLRVTEGELVAFTLCWTKFSTWNIVFLKRKHERTRWLKILSLQDASASDNSNFTLLHWFDNSINSHESFKLPGGVEGKNETGILSKCLFFHFPARLSDVHNWKASQLFLKKFPFSELCEMLFVLSFLQFYNSG